MCSRCPYSRGGECSKNQQCSSVGTIQSPLDIKGTPSSVVPAKNGIKNNMGTIRYPGELKVAHGPTPLHQGYAQSQQHLEGLHYPRKSQSSILDTGFQHPIPGDSAGYSRGSHNHISRDGNASIYSSTHVSSQHISYLGNSAESVRRPVYNSSHQQQVWSRSLSREKVLPVGESKPPSDEEIHDFVAKRVHFFWTITKYVYSKKLYNRDYPLRSDSISPKVDSFYHPHETSASANEDMGRQSLCVAVSEEFTAAVGPALEEEGSRGNNAFAVLPPKFKGTDDCSASASEKHSKEHPRERKILPATCSKDEDGSPVVAAAVPGMTFEEMTEKQSNSMFNSSLSEEHKSPWLIIKTHFDDKGQVPGVSRAPKHTMEKETSKVALIPVGLIGLDKLQDMTDLSVVSENQTFGQESLVNVHSKKNIDKLCSPVDALRIDHVWSIQTNQTKCIALPKNEVENHIPLSESAGQRPLFVNMPQYEDISDDDSQLPNTEHKEFNFPTASEDIREEDSPHIDYMTAETSSTTPDPNIKLSPFEHEGAGYVPKFETEIQTYHSILCSPSPSLKEDVTDTFDEDEDDDDDMLFIPLTISDLEFEPQEQDGLYGGETEDQERQCDAYLNHNPSPKPVQASDYTPMKEFDTIESFFKAVNFKQIQVALIGKAEHKMDSEGEGHTLNSRGSSDSCETDDSCNYSKPENKYLAVPRTLLERKVAPEPSETDASVPEGKANEVTNVQQGQTRSLAGSGCTLICTSTTGEKDCSKNVQPSTNGQNILNDVIIIESDSEDECKQNYQQPKRKRFFSSSSEDSNYSSCETVEEKTSADRDREINGQLRGSTNSLVVIDSDIDDDDDLNYKDQSRKRLSVEQKKPVFITVESDCGPADEIPQETRQSSADLSQSQNQSMLPDTPQKTNGHDSNSGEVNNKRRKKVKSRSILESDDIDDETVGSLCGIAYEKSKNSQFSKDQRKKQSHSLNKKADSTSKSVIPRLVVEKPNQHYRLLEECPKDRRGKNGTPKHSTASSKKTDSVDKNKLHLPKPKRAKGGEHTTKNNVQANVPKPTTISRQLSLPEQKCTSTSLSGSGKLSEARQSSAISRNGSLSGGTPACSQQPAFKPSISTPRDMSSLKLQRSLSWNNSSTINHPINPTKGPSVTSATIAPSARKRLTQEMAEFIPIPRQKKKPEPKVKKSLPGMEDDLTTGTLPIHHNRAPKRRQNSKSATPLMKRTKLDAVQLTKARIRDSPKEQGNYGGEGYKWSEKPPVTPTIQGFGRKTKL